MRRLSFLQKPLLRLLAINLAIGASLAVLLVGGLLVANPGGLRDLILADQSPGVVLGLLLGSFIVTLGSTAMGTAVMALGQRDDSGPRGLPEFVTEKLKISKTAMQTVRSPSGCSEYRAPGSVRLQPDA